MWTGDLTRQTLTKPNTLRDMSGPSRNRNMLLSWRRDVLLRKLRYRLHVVIIVFFRGGSTWKPLALYKGEQTLYVASRRLALPNKHTDKIKRSWLSLSYHRNLKDSIDLSQYHHIFASGGIDLIIFVQTVIANRMEPHRTVTKEEFDSYVENSLKEEEGKTIIVTPQEDTKLVEELLGLPTGSFGESFIGVRGNQACPNCDRRTSFLDIVNDGVSFHGNGFIKDVVEGKRGYVYDPNPPRPHKCYKCKEASPVEVLIYRCQGYLCW